MCAIAVPAVVRRVDTAVGIVIAPNPEDYIHFLAITLNRCAIAVTAVVFLYTFRRKCND